MNKSKIDWHRYLPILVLVCMSGAPQSAVTDDMLLAPGIAFEYNMYGQPGVVAAVGHKKLFGGHPQLRIQYTTSGLSLWNGPYDLTVHDLYVNLSWAFRPNKIVNPYAGFDIGRTWYDREDNELFKRLDNSAMRLNLRSGVCFSAGGGRVLPYVDGGYAVMLSSTTFPLFISCGVQYALLKGGR